MNRHICKSSLNDVPVRVAPIMAIPLVLKTLGANSDRIYTAAKFDPAAFDNPDNVISFAARGRLIAECVAQTGCRHFGLLVGEHGGLQVLGAVGLLAKYAPDAGSALRQIVHHFHLHVRAASIGLDDDGDFATLSYCVHQFDSEAVDQIGDGAVAMLCNTMRTLCGPDWQATEVQFAHSWPEAVQPFRRFFRAPLRFNAPRYAVQFEARWLDHRLPEIDDELRQLIVKQIEALEAHDGEDLPALVRSALRIRLMTDQAGAEEIASLFSMHPRTLARRLHACGTSFRDICDQIRYETAQQTLRDTSLDVGEIAALLNYAEPSAFARAFRRWSGTTPSHWRANHPR